MDRMVLALKLEGPQLKITASDSSGWVQTSYRRNAPEIIGIILEKYRGLFASSIYDASEGGLFHDSAQAIGRDLHSLIFEGLSLDFSAFRELLVIQDRMFLPTELAFDGLSFLCINVRVGNQLATSNLPHRQELSAWKSFAQSGSYSKHSSALLVGYDGGELDRVFDSDRLRCTRITPPSRENILSAMSSNTWPIIHLAGHGYYPDRGAEDCGLLVRSGAEQPFGAPTLSIHDLARPQGLRNSFVFLNACRAGDLTSEPPQLRMARQFMEAGAKCCVIGTTPLSDRGAEMFAAEFYRQMLFGSSVGEALSRARISRFEEGDLMTALSYVLFGDPSSKLQQTHRGISDEIQKKPDYGIPIFR